MFQIWQLNGVNIIHKDDNENSRIQYKGYSTLIPFSNSILCGNSSMSLKISCLRKQTLKL
jgi:hypothetical protein